MILGRLGRGNLEIQRHLLALVSIISKKRGPLRLQAQAIYLLRLLLRVVSAAFLPPRSSISFQRAAMPNEFDPYREALVMEETTLWPDQFEDWEPADRARVAAALHADPKNCSELSYLRQHTGFARQITVTQGDLERLAAR
jgi:hypothetical protein